MTASAWVRNVEAILSMSGRIPPTLSLMFPSLQSQKSTRYTLVPSTDTPPDYGNPRGRRGYAGSGRLHSFGVRHASTERTTPVQKVLIANRGEIAVRIA